ncbi:hypothetical protein [Paraburkholderia caledonica]|uniref:hypothetical protein n=1 Tax=Paraburkholderia caledonica TaxID=134536 RepID=UPI000DEEDBF0|nr:hypothetical protein [Paraburkholderia caledonica]AXF14576.1 hypothetical protein CUJ87_09310 [Paraburkholderia caledonica]
MNDPVPAQPDLVPTQADPELYRCGWGLVWAAFGVPAFFLLLDLYLCRADLFARSGALAVFLAAVAQFQQLSLLQKKHIANAIRAKRDEAIRDISPQYGRLERWAFFAGLYGTLIWAYGDMLEKVLMR